MIFIAGRLWDHFLMILEVAKKREEKEEKQIPNMGRSREYFGCIYWGRIRIF